jgi:23S rRNA (cytidine1920-2'-O)/16S rRNA (cytidine1409-2'-O)-methyltransferase
LDWKLRRDGRVVVMENTNARFVDHLPEPVELVTMDVSFISLKVLLPVIRNWFLPRPDGGIESCGWVIALVKPQFEAGRQQVGRGHGVIRDPAVHRQVLLEVLSFAGQQGYGLRGLMRSPLTGPKGNIEFLAWLEVPGTLPASLEAWVDPLVTGT